MARQPFTARYTTLELYLKHLKIVPHTRYTLTLDSLGGEMELFFSDGDGVRHLPACSEWTHHTFTISVGNNAAEFADWGICLVKTAWAWHAYGGTYGTTYLDNVGLYADGDTENLLSGGDFERPINETIYDKHWRPTVLGGSGASFGIRIVADPLNKTNHCLCIPSVITPMTYPHPFPLEAHTFGAFSDIECDIHCIEFHGRPEHRFLIVERGMITVECRGTHTVPSGSLICLPPDIPYRYTYHAGDDTSYRWLSVKGDHLTDVLSTLKLDDYCPHAVTNVTALVARVDTMLQQTEAETYSLAIIGHLHLFFSELEHALFPKRLSPKHLHTVAAVAERLRKHPENALSNATLAAECGLSENYFIGLFTQIVGMPPQKYRLRALVDKACVTLKDTDLTIQEVAYSLGIDDPLYFSRLFKSIRGISPQKYRQSLQ